MTIQKALTFIIILLINFSLNAVSQNACTALGQNPSTAFPVCGLRTFTQASVAICGDQQIASTCSSINLDDKNPYWYKFTCFKTGSLGFTITPLAENEDYDWQLFDVTNVDPKDVYTNKTLLLMFNWAPKFGVTGTSSTSTYTDGCNLETNQNISAMPLLIIGHQYLLLVSHFSDTQSGYTLAFDGGTAIITDPILPAMQQVTASCDGNQIYIKLNKKMKCATLDADGSDFKISSGAVSIVSAAGVGCNNSFDMDSIVLSLSKPLPAGIYQLSIATGADGNNLLDNCDQSIAAGQTLSITVLRSISNTSATLLPASCRPKQLTLVFSDPISCNSIAQNGSDFLITGTQTVGITSAVTNCNTAGFTKSVLLNLSSPILAAGNYNISITTGTDANTIINECKKETIQGTIIDFNISAAVSATFTYNIRLGCIADTIDYRHDGENGVTTWKWLFDNNSNSNLKSTNLIYYTTGTKTAQLTVSNGTCTDISTVNIVLEDKVKAVFQYPEIICAGSATQYINNSKGPVTLYNWSLGNLNTSTLPMPPAQYYTYNNLLKNITVQLLVQDKQGCSDIATRKIAVENCYLAVPKAFSPNNDGLNDLLYPTYSPNVSNLRFTIYNRFGQMVFEGKEWLIKWDGSFKGNPQDAGTYIWKLIYTDIINRKTVNLKGTSVLLR